MLLLLEIEKDLKNHEFEKQKEKKVTKMSRL